MQKFISSCVGAFLFFAHPVHSFSQSGDLLVTAEDQLISMVPETVQTNSVVKQPFNIVQKSATPDGVPESECNPSVSASAQDYLLMQNVIIDFFNAMNKGSINGLQAVCTKNATFKTHLQDQYGNHHIMDETISSLIPFVAQAGNCFNLDIQFELLPPDVSSMQFRTPYIFLVNNAVSHCGVCTFEFEIADGGWKIKQMVDTRSRSCK